MLTPLPTKPADGLLNFAKQDHVPWTEFASSFYDFLRLSIPNDPDPEFESGTLFLTQLKPSRAAVVCSLQSNVR